MNQKFFLNSPDSKKGIYLSQQQIDLLFIVSCESKEQLEDYFYKMCGQFPNQKIEDVIEDYELLSVEEAKRILFIKYQNSLSEYKTNHRMTLQEQALDKLSKIRLSDGSSIPPEVMKEAIYRLDSVKLEMLVLLQNSQLPQSYIVACINEINKLPNNASPTAIIRIMKKIAANFDIPETEVINIRPTIKEMMKRVQSCIDSILLMTAECDKKLTQTNSPNAQVDEFIQKFNRLMKDDFENIKSVSYEDICALHKEIISNDEIDTIIIATGKYDNSIYSSGKSSYFDVYLTAKGLQYCKMTGKHMRYHALFDYAHLTKLVNEGKGPEDKEQILAEMREFVKASFEFINNYNASVKGTNKPTINVVEIFNELVEYNKQDEGPYEMAWEKYFGITISDILKCFEGIKKPEGVEFMYNETQLEESPKRVAKVEEVFKEIMSSRPDLIDVFGNQMHLQHTHADPNIQSPNIGPEAVAQGLDLMKKIQESDYVLKDGTTKRVRSEITEFDLHICKETYLEKVIPMLKNGTYTPEQIITQKQEWIKFISEMVQSRGLKLDRITYWTLLDSVDHNLVRAGKAILDKEPDKSIEELTSEGKLPDSLYAGVFGTGTSPLPTYKQEIHPILNTEQFSEEQTLIEESQTRKTIKDKPKTLTLRMNNRIPNSGYISEYIILIIIITILLSLVMLTIFSIT